MHQRVPFVVVVVVVVVVDLVSSFGLKYSIRVPHVPVAFLNRCFFFPLMHLILSVLECVVDDGELGKWGNESREREREKERE